MKQFVNVTGKETVFDENKVAKKRKIHCEIRELCEDGYRTVPVIPSPTTKDMTLDVPMGEHFLVIEEGSFKDQTGTQRKYHSLISVNDPKEIGALKALLAKMSGLVKA